MSLIENDNLGQGFFPSTSFVLKPSTSSHRQCQMASTTSGRDWTSSCSTAQASGFKAGGAH